MRDQDVPGTGFEAVIPNPKLKLMDQVREVMRLRHYSFRTERSYCDWIRRYVRFHQVQSRADLKPAEAKIEAFLSHLAIHGHVAINKAIKAAVDRVGLTKRASSHTFRQNAAVSEDGSGSTLVKILCAKVRR